MTSACGHPDSVLTWWSSAARAVRTSTSAKAEDYAIARHALVTAWPELPLELDRGGRRSATMISVTMLHGAAVETAAFTERLTDQQA